MDEWMIFYNAMYSSSQSNTLTPDNINSSVNSPLLSILNKSNVSYANVEDIVTYHLYIKNTSPYVLENIILKDLLSNDVRFITNSVEINSISMPNYSIISGIKIENLNQGEEVKISFDVETVSVGVVKNQITATYDYYSSQEQNTIIGTNSSNINTFYINSAQLKITKISNFKEVSLNDIIEYNVKISNVGDLDIFNIVFKDKLPQYLKFIPNSFMLNQNYINSVDLASGVNIGSLSVGSYFNIKYKVKVISNPCNYQIMNEATATYLYKLPNGVVGKSSSTTKLNDLNIINMRTANFKQFNICEYLLIPDEKPPIEDINNILGEIEIVKSHIITTPKIESLEGQILSGYKIIIHGLLKLVIEYTACEVLQSVHSAHYYIPFSTFVILPIDFVFGSKVQVYPVVEDIYSKSIDCKTLFIDATTMVSVKILSC